MEEGTDYYIYMGGVKGCNADLRLQGAGTIYAYDAEINEPASYKVLSEKNSQQINAAYPEDVQWLKFVVPEDGKYKLSYKEENNASRVQLFGSSNEKLTDKVWYSQPTDDRSYYDLKKGEVCYLACTSFKGQASYKVSIKKVTVKEVYANKDHAFAVRKSTKASAVAAVQAKTSIDYLNKIYTPNPSFATRIDHADQQDIAAFKKMAEIITKGCQTEKEKVEAITRWVKKNIKYDTTVSSYSTEVFKSRKGDCQGMSILIADFCRSLGMPAAYAAGWKEDHLTMWTIDDLYHSYDRHKFAEHGWDMIYFDGKWHMYDVLFDNYDVTDSNTMAEKGYYFAFIEGMPIAGDGLDPALAGIDVGGMLVTSCYYQGNFVTLVYGRLSDREYQYEVDQDGDICKAAWMGGTIRHQNLEMEDQFFPTMTSNVIYFPYSDEISKNGGLYDDGRRDPDAGYLYTNGWLFGEYLADVDGVLCNMDLKTIGDKIYYFGKNGDAQILNMNTDDYYMYKGQLYIKTGASGSVIPTLVEKYLNDSNYVISTWIIEAFDSKGNEVNGSNLIKINSKDCTIKTLNPGCVCYRIRVRRVDDDENTYLMDKDVQLNITDQGKPIYSFEDTPPSSDEKPTPDDNFGNKSDNDKNDSSDNKNNNSSDTNSDQTPKVNPTVQKVVLTQTSYIYDGKVKNPAVKIFDSNGKQLSSKDYTISKASGRKNVGKYKYTITFKNGYAGKKILYFTINPKPTKLTSLKKGSKKMKLKWKKVSSQASGYQIRYSTKSSMSGAKTVTVKKYKTSSKTISRLKKKKKYYVQIRTYKTVGKDKYYSNWSARKSIVTK